MKGVYKIFVRDRELINIIDTKYMDKFLKLFPSVWRFS